MSAHHEFSPSKLDGFALCPGKRAAVARIRAEMSEEDWDNYDSNEAAAEGSMLHEVMAGKSPPAPLTVEQKEQIEKCFAYRRMHFADCDDILLEKKITLMDGFDVLTEGTADVIGVRGNLLKLCDWKFGRRWVSPNSLQLKAYAAAVMQTFGVNICECHIFQPRAGDGKPIMFTNFDEIFQEVKAVIKQAKSPYAELRPGEHCGYCPARLDCTACANLETALMRQQDSLLVNPARLGQAAEVAVLVKKRCDQILALCKDATIAGKPTGWKILEKQGRATVTNAKTALVRLGNLVSQDEYVSILTVPFGELRELVANKLKQRDGLTAKQSEVWLVEALGDVLARGEPSRVCVIDKKGKK